MLNRAVFPFRASARALLVGLSLAACLSACSWLKPNDQKYQEAREVKSVSNADSLDPIMKSSTFEIPTGKASASAAERPPEIQGVSTSGSALARIDGDTVVINTSVSAAFDDVAAALDRQGVLIDDKNSDQREIRVRVERETAADAKGLKRWWRKSRGSKEGLIAVLKLEEIDAASTRVTIEGDADAKDKVDRKIKQDVIENIVRGLDKG
jgi:uncharacterized lipoprotein